MKYFNYKSIKIQECQKDLECFNSINNQFLNGFLKENEHVSLTSVRIKKDYLINYNFSNNDLYYWLYKFVANLLCSSTFTIQDLIC